MTSLMLILLDLNLPWLLIGLGLAVLAMAAAPKFGWPRIVEEWACIAAALLGVLHVIQSIAQAAPPQIFLNEVFFQRMIASVLMLTGAWLGRRRSVTFSPILGVTAAVWAILSIVAEGMRVHINFLGPLGYGVLIAALLLSVLIGRRVALHPMIGGLLIFSLLGSGWLAAPASSAFFVLVYLALTPVSLIAVAWSGRHTVNEDNSDFYPSLAIGLLPFALLPWAISTADLAGLKTDFFAGTTAIAGIVLAAAAGRYGLSSSERWHSRIAPLHGLFTSLVLILVTLFHIERGAWPIAFELLALTYLIVYVTRRSHERSGAASRAIGAMMVLAAALVLQAMLLRAFGPPQAVLNALDIHRVQLPAVASLMWAVFGACLTWWGAYHQSRSMWTAGSLLLVTAAVKLVLFDFEALGQPGNIIAFIAAGLVFFAVAWFAPIPPKTAAAPRPGDEEWQPAGAGIGQRQAHPDLAGQTGKFVAEDESPDAGIYSDNRGTSCPHAEANRANGMWFAFLILSIVIAVFASLWQKYNRHQEERHWHRQITAEVIPASAGATTSSALYQRNESSS